MPPDPKRASILKRPAIDPVRSGTVSNRSDVWSSASGIFNLVPCREGINEAASGCIVLFGGSRELTGHFRRPIERATAKHIDAVVIENATNGRWRQGRILLQQQRANA